MVYCGKPSKGCSNCRERKIRVGFIASSTNQPLFLFLFLFLSSLTLESFIFIFIFMQPSCDVYLLTLLLFLPPVVRSKRPRLRPMHQAPD